MANVMLSSESSKDPSIPFRTRIQALRVRFDDILIESNKVLSLEEEYAGDAERDAAYEEKSKNQVEALTKTLDEFNTTCDEIYKEIQRRRQRLLNSDEGSINAQELQLRLQSAGHLTQLLADFRVFLETGEHIAIALDPKTPGATPGATPNKATPI